MTSIVNRTMETYNYILNDLADPRTSEFFLIPSPWPILSLTALYLYFCTSVGPRYMRDKQPYNLKYVVLVYNVVQVLMTSYMVYEGIRYMSSSKFSFKCDPIDYSDNPRAIRLTNAAWWYFFSKVTEFLDTVFFVLRKKNNQITFLHVYHHSLMAVVTWAGVKYFAGGHAILMGTLNAFVHIVMYTYYFIAGLGPQYQKYIWWKKHVTVLQLTQFVIILIHNLVALFSDCTYPKLANITMIFNSLLFINLFGRFFIASYINKPDTNGTVQKEKVKNGIAKNGTVKNGTAKNGTVKNGTAKNGSVKNGTVENGTVKNGTVENGTVTNRTVKNGIHKNGSTNTHGQQEDKLNKNGVSVNGKSKNI